MCLGILTACAGHQEAPVPSPLLTDKVAYDYAVENPWLATIAGTPAAQEAQLPDPKDWERRTITVFPSRQTPEGFWYNKGLNYTVARQRGRAPLAFVIGGTGADDRSRLTIALGRILYAAGMHVVLLPSPTHANFIISASETYLPGRPSQDAADLYRVMRIIRAELDDQVDISDVHLSGYSLGAWHAAFVAQLDEDEQAFGFKRVLLLNPPVSLYASIQVIDRMLEQNLPGGIDNLSGFIERAVSRLSSLSESGTLVDLDSDAAFGLYEKLRPTDDRLAAAIGLSFRLSSANMIFTSDVMSQSGYIFPKGKPFQSTTPLQEYLAVLLQTSLDDYFDDMYADLYGGPKRSRDVLVREASLVSIGDYLRSAKKIGMFTNRDDVILTPRDIETLKNLFGDRARIYPNGGHLGNLESRAVVADIMGFFQ